MSQTESELPILSDVENDTDWMESMEFSQVLGAGSYGVVLKDEHWTFESDWTYSAVKIIFADYSTDPNVKAGEREKMLREANTVISKRHPHIVKTTNFAEKSLGPADIDKIFEKMSFEGKARQMVDMYTAAARRVGELETIWIGMELCGHNLRSWLNQNNHSELHIALLQCGIVKGLVDGLKYLHQNKILHRDFKPENIYFSLEYLLPVKIGDFGLSREWFDDTSLTSQLGTKDYRAPEAEFRNYSFQADLYSLGLVIWEVIQLIRDKDRKGLFDRLVYGREESLVAPRKHPRIAPNCKEIIVKLTRRRVEERTQSIQEINLIILKIKVTSSEELKVYLKLAMEGDVIELDEGEYLGPFDMAQRRVTLRGQGEKTRIINKAKGPPYNRVFAISIRGDNCQVLCLKVICDSNEYTFGIELVGSGNQMEDVNFQGGAGCLHVEGSENHLSNLSFSNSENGLWLEGSDNNVVNIRIREMTGIGIGIHGDKNELELVNCENVGTGVYVFGDSNKLRNIDLNNTRFIPMSTGVSILSGRGNVVNTLKCSSFVLELSNLTSESFVINSVCNEIIVEGSDHTLVNVDGGTHIRIFGKDHRIINCKAERCTNEGTDVILVECNF